MIYFIKMNYVNFESNFLYLKFNNLAIPGSTSIVISISFFSGIILFTLGILGIYLARIFEQTKGREQYVIKEIKDYK